MQEQTFEKDPQLFVEDPLTEEEEDLCNATMTSMQSHLSKIILRNGGTCAFEKLLKGVHSFVFCLGYKRKLNLFFQT